MPWVGCSGPPTAAHSQSPSFKLFGNGNQLLKSSGRPNKLLRGFAHLLHCLFEKEYHHPTPYAPQSSWWGASDASASDSGEAYVGGWISNHPKPREESGLVASLPGQGKTNMLGPSKIASPSVALRVWRCWVHSFSRCTFARRARPSGDRCFCPWRVITRAISMDC